MVPLAKASPTGLSGLRGVVNGEVGLKRALFWSGSGVELGEMRLRIEDEDRDRETYGRGDGFGCSVAGEKVGETGEACPRSCGKSPAPEMISIPNSSVRGRGGGLSTIASSNFRKSVRIV